MKNAFSLKVSWCVIFLLLSVFLFGQKKYSLSLQVNQGIIGLEKDQKRILNFKEIQEETIPGGIFSAGIKNDFSFFRKEILGVSFGILWNYYSFVRKEDESSIFLFGPGSLSDFETTFRFSSHSVIFPISLNTQIWKIGFSVGIIPRYHIGTKLTKELLIKFNDPTNDYEVKVLVYEAGKLNTNVLSHFGCEEDVSLENQIDMQILLGMNLFLSENLSLGLEYKNIVDVNYMKVFCSENHNNNINYDFNSRGITLGLSWRIFSAEDNLKH